MNALTSSAFTFSGVSAEDVIFKDRTSILVTMPPASYQNLQTEKLTDRALFAWLPIDFANGTIEVDVASVLAPDAPAFARGFIGLAFRIDNDLNFEAIYLRPANSRVEDLVRRNHSTQYFSFPDYDFARLRREEPEKYESYVDIDLEEWIRMKIVIQESSANLFVNAGQQPVLVVNDLKLGPNQKGGVGLWIESGTMGYFSDLRIVDAEVRA
jgi:hypothetical protein